MAKHITKIITVYSDGSVDVATVGLVHTLDVDPPPGKDTPPDPPPHPE